MKNRVLKSISLASAQGLAHDPGLLWIRANPAVGAVQIPQISNQKPRPLVPLAREYETQTSPYLLRASGIPLAPGQPLVHRDLLAQLAQHSTPLTPLALQLQDMRQRLYRNENLLQEEAQEKKRLEELSQTYFQQIKQLERLNQELNHQIQAIEERTVFAQAQPPAPPAPPASPTQSQGEEIQQAMASLARQLEDLKNQAQQKQAELNSLLQANQKLLQEGQSLKADYEALRSLKKNLLSALQNTQAELEKKKAESKDESALEPLRKQIHQLKQRIAVQEEKLTQLEPLHRKYTAQLQEKASLEKHLQGLEKDIQLKKGKQVALQAKLQEQGEKLQSAQQQLRLYQEEQASQTKLIQEQREKLSQLRQDKEKLSVFIRELHTKLQSARNQLNLKTQTAQEFLQKSSAIAPDKPKPTKTSVKKVTLRKQDRVARQPITQVPNLINGTVRDNQSQLLSDAVVIVKDLQNNPLRAVRTNQLGQFLLITPLPSNRYLIETSYPGQIFDILEVELSGEVMPPLEITSSQTHV